MQDSKQYNTIAQEYSDIFVEENQQSITAYFNHVDFDVKNKKILDLGCGDGYDLSLLGERGGLLHGIDASEAMLALAREKNPHAELKMGFFEDIPYSDETFDIVMSKW